MPVLRHRHVDTTRFSTAAPSDSEHIMRLNTFISNNRAAITAEPALGVSGRTQLTLHARNNPPAASTHCDITLLFCCYELLTSARRCIQRSQESIPLPSISTGYPKQNPLQTGPIPAV